MMASSPEFAKFVADQISGAGDILHKKLFGEYGYWMGGKLFATVENDEFYVKVTEAGRKLLPDAVPVAPHGGKPNMFPVEELDDREFLKELVERTCAELPPPKEKAPKRPKMSPIKPRPVILEVEDCSETDNS